MGEIVNLRRVRKAKARADDAAQAADNRVRSGLTKIEREAAQQAKGRVDRKLDGHRIVRIPD